MHNWTLENIHAAAGGFQRDFRVLMEDATLNIARAAAVLRRSAKIGRGEAVNAWCGQ